jgi:hypothetical protein
VGFGSGISVHIHREYNEGYPDEGKSNPISSAHGFLENEYAKQELEDRGDVLQNPQCGKGNAR